MDHAGVLSSRSCIQKVHCMASSIKILRACRKRSHDDCSNNCRLKWIQCQTLNLKFTDIRRIQGEASVDMLPAYSRRICWWSSNFWVRIRSQTLHLQVASTSQSSFVEFRACTTCTHGHQWWTGVRVAHLDINSLPAGVPVFVDRHYEGLKPWMYM